MKILIPSIRIEKQKILYRQYLGLQKLRHDVETDGKGVKVVGETINDIMKI